jgi:imidazolonepropionase-like amidohydrolase
MKLNGVLIVAACLAAGTRCVPTLAQDLVIRGVSVVDVERGRMLPDRDVLIDGERILDVVRSGEAEIPEEARVVDGAGLYVLPGLFDAHVHHSAAPETYNKLQIAWGVTAVRDTGAETSAILAMREANAEPGVIAPRIICTGAIIDGNPPVWPFSEACETPEQGRAAVAKLHDAGVDQIKVYSRLLPDVYQAVVDEAHKRGLKVTGHVPARVTVLQGLSAGQDCNEHLMQMEDALARLAGQSPDLAMSGAGPSWSVYDEVPRDALERFLRRLAGEEGGSQGMVQCPTLVVYRGYSDTLADDPGAHPQMAYQPAHMKQMWKGFTIPAMAEHMKAGLPYAIKLVGDMHRAGVTIMAGTDLANPYVYPGYSLHEEMAFLVEAGMTPWEAIKAATITPAEFCGLEDEIGTVSPGKQANLVLVRENPLELIDNTREIEAVVLRGAMLDRAALDALLEEAEAAAGAPALADAEGGADDGAEDGLDFDGPGRVVSRGRYGIKFEQWDAGTEAFAVSIDGEHMVYTAKTRPQGGPQPPTDVTIRYAEGWAFAGAEWSVSRGQQVRASYEFDGKVLRVTGTRGEEELTPIELEVPEGAIFMPPGTAGSAGTYLGLDLEENEERPFQAVSWGYPGHEPSLGQVSIKREEEIEYDVGGKRVRCRHYVTRMDTEAGQFWQETWISQQGVVVAVELRMPMGMLKIEINELR